VEGFASGTNTSKHRNPRHSSCIGTMFTDGVDGISRHWISPMDGSYPRKTFPILEPTREFRTCAVCRSRRVSLRNLLSMETASCVWQTVVRKMSSLAPLLAYDPIHFLIFGEGERKRMAARLQPCDTPVAARSVCFSTPNSTNQPSMFRT
jgi:hypothetical protein